MSINREPSIENDSFVPLGQAAESIRGGPDNEPSEANEETVPASSNTAAPAPNALRRIGSLVVAGVFFVLAIVGILLPVLPTTPFLLLTSYFLIRSSPRLNEKLLRSRTFGPILVDWQVHGGVRRDIKIKAIVVVVIAVGLTIYLSGYSWWITGLVIALASIGIGVILRLPIARNGQ